MKHAVDDRLIEKLCRELERGSRFFGLTGFELSAGRLDSGSKRSSSAAILFATFDILSVSLLSGLMIRHIAVLSN